MKYLNRVIVKKILILFLFVGNLAYANLTESEEIVATLSKTIHEVVYLMSLDNGKNTNEIKQLVIDKTINLFDFNRLTALVVGFPWKEATIEQKIELSREFKYKLINSYYRALVHVKDAKVEVNPRVLIKNNGKEIVIQSKASSKSINAEHPISIDYYLYHTESGYKIYNVNVEGVSLVTAFRGEFAEIIQKEGIEGLINQLKNNKDKKDSKTLPHQINGENISEELKLDVQKNILSYKDLCYLYPFFLPEMGC